MKTINGKTVLITGGAGFIGSRFSDTLIKMGCRVMVYDDLSSGRYDLIKHLAKNKRFTFVKGDLLDLGRLSSQFRKHEPEIVIHLAANPDVRKGLANTRLDLEQGTIVTYNVMEASRKFGIDDVMFASSSVVYGDSKVKPTPEDYAPLAPISLYGASKLASEGLVTSFSHLYDFDYYIYRFANIVGENLTHSVILDLIRRLNKNRKTLDVLGDGTQKKGYLDVGDCISAMLLVYKKSGERGNIYNISLKDQISVREMAEAVVRRFSPTTRLRFAKTNYGWPGDIVNTFLSGEKIRKIGFRPKYKTSRAAVLHAIEANSSLYNPK